MPRPKSQAKPARAVRAVKRESKSKECATDVSTVAASDASVSRVK